MIDDFDFDPQLPSDLSDPIAVTAPSGAVFTVLNSQEEDYFNKVSNRYINDYSFSNISDLQDVDKIIVMELLTHRWSSWLFNEVDYWGEPIDADAIKKSLNDYTKEIRLQKKQLGMDKPSRDKVKGESASDYIEDLRERAKEFGVMRNEQASKSIELFKELEALVTLHDNCTEEERRENKVEIEDLFKWLRETAFPEFEEIDRKFRQTSQKYWIRQQ